VPDLTNAGVPLITRHQIDIRPDRYECVEMEEMMLRLSEFSQNHHTFEVEILDKYIRGGISVI
jgi:hypothetical protein